MKINVALWEPEFLSSTYMWGFHVFLSFINYHRAYNPRLFRLQNRIAHQENQLTKSEDDKPKSSTHTEKVKEFQKVSNLTAVED